MKRGKKLYIKTTPGIKEKIQVNSFDDLIGHLKKFSKNSNVISDSLKPFGTVVLWEEENRINEAINETNNISELLGLRDEIKSCLKVLIDISLSNDDKEYILLQRNFEMLEALVCGYIETEERYNTDEKEKVFKFHMDNELITRLFSICENEVISSSFIEFYRAIGAGDFSRLDIKIKYKVQHLVFKLSKKINKEWYTSVTNSMLWGKSECSKHRTALDTDEWSIKLDKILQ